MTTRHRLRAALAAALLGALPAPAQDAAQDPAQNLRGLQLYREMSAQDNPGELWAERGKELFQSPRGPKQASLAACDFGLGPGELKGAYARLPRYFADTDKVEDLESRLMTCMVALQGLREEDIKRTAFGNLDRDSDMEALAAYVAVQSNGMKIRRPPRPPAGAVRVRARREDLLPAQRPARLRLRELPRRGREAHPPAGSAQHAGPGADPGDHRRLAGVSRDAEHGAHDAVPALRLQLADAAAAARVRLRRSRSRSRPISPTRRTAARSTRRACSADEGRADDDDPVRLRFLAALAALAAASCATSAAGADRADLQRALDQAYARATAEQRARRVQDEAQALCIEARRRAACAEASRRS